MKLTPLDLRQHRFHITFRGFDRTEVVALLTEAAEDYERAIREADRLRDDISRMEAVLSEHREHERNLRNTLLTAQRVADETRENAHQEAQRIIREAEGRAELLLQKTHSRADAIHREIEALRLKRRDVETMLESTISGLRHALDFVHTQEPRNQDEEGEQPRPAPQGASRAPLQPAAVGECKM